MEKQKIIFLDLDGVLNAFDYAYLLSSLRKMEIRTKGCSYTDKLDNKTKDEFGSIFDPRCCSWLSYIVDMTDAKIVISSTWKRDGLTEMQRLWEVRKLPGKVIGITPNCHNLETEYTGTKFERFRGVEIDQFLKQFPTDQYCIIDDRNDMLPHQMNNLCQTICDYGITQEIAQQAIDILNNN